MSFPKKVLIVGGGFGGVRAGLDLARHNYSDLEITLIDKTGWHYFPPEFYKLIYFREDDKITYDFFKEAVHRFAIPLYEIFKDKNNLKLVVDEVSEISLEKNEVRTKSGTKFDYDYLILAVGSETEYFGKQGVREFAYPFKTIQDSLNIRNIIDELFFKKAKHEPIRILLIGGGLTGVETAANLAETVFTLAQIHSHPRETISIEIVEAGPTILSQLSPWARRKAHSRLKKLGVKITVNSAITEAKQKEAVTKEGKIIPYDFLIWTVGVRGNRLLEKLGDKIKLEKKCLLPIDEYLKVPGFENVFAVGDIACFKDESGKTFPMTAQNAIWQAKYVAYTIKRLIHGRRIYKFHPKGFGFIAPLGRNYGIANAGLLKLWGLPAIWLRKLANLRYLLSILPVKKALFYWFKW